jgi:hypothetical protein
MFGWINFVVRDLLIKKYSDDIWAKVCLIISIPTSTTYPRHKYFSDASTIALIEAASRYYKVFWTKQ